MERTESAPFLVVESVHGEQTHSFLKSKDWLESSLEPLRTSTGTIGFPLMGLEHDETALNAVRNHLGIDASIVVGETRHRPSVDPHDRLRNAVTTWLEGHGVEAEVNDLLPTKWEKLGELVLLPHELGQTKAWEKVRQHPMVRDLWKGMAGALKVTSVGLQAPIANNTFRSAQVDMLLGSSHVRFSDHGVMFAFDASKVMFSSGNITERRRIGTMDMQGEVVVDAYAGVGYYTFHMLVNAGAAHVHACEINPASLTGLKAGAEANGLVERMTVHAGDNALALETLRGTADRCHLGLLPSSEPVWEACMLALKPTGGVLHIHMNVEEENIERWTNATVERFQKLVAQHSLSFNVQPMHVERVKWFAPRVRHVVLDLRFRP
jgi:tRNA wybutosine-synthesizing protein 3